MLILFKTSVVTLREFLVVFWLLHLTTHLGLFGFRAGNGKSLRLTEAIGKYSLKPLRRLFLTEGAVTIVFGIAVWFLLPDCEYIPSREVESS